MTSTGRVSRLRTVLLVTGTVVAAATAFSPAAAGAASTLAPARTVTLATYDGDPAREGYTPTETAIKETDVAEMQPLWSYKAAGTISDQPAVVDGTAYWGDWAGDEHATSAAGKNLWTTSLGQTRAPQCDPSRVGVASSATVGTVNGREVVITGGGAGTVAELQASTGTVIWNTRIAPKIGGFVWSSPLLYNGSVYIGMSSFGDCPLVRSGVFMLNAATGAIEHKFSTVPPGGCLGSGVWSSPALDQAEASLFVTTGNATCTTPLQEAMLKLSLANLSLESSWAIPPSQAVHDSDWGSSPTLFTAEIAGKLVQLVGSADKNGIFYALNAAHLARGPVWEYQIARGGSNPLAGEGSISPASWDGTTLYVAGGSTTVGTVSCAGSVDALDPATGQPLWRDCLQGGPVLGALTEVPGLLFVTEGPDLVALDARNGAQLFAFTDTNETPFYGPATVAGGVVYAGNTDGNLFAWGVVGDTSAGNEASASEALPTWSAVGAAPALRTRVRGRQREARRGPQCFFGSSAHW